MTLLLLAAAAIVVRVEAVPSSPGTATVDVVCREGPVSTQSVPFGSDAALVLPCQPSALVFRAEGYVSQTVSQAAWQGKVHVNLEKKAKIEAASPQEGDMIVAWRPGPGLPLEQARLGGGVPHVWLTPGAGCLVVMRPQRAPEVAARRLSAGESMVLRAQSTSQGVAVNGEVLDPEGIPIAAVVDVRRDGESGAGRADKADGCEAVLDELGVTRRHTERSGRFSLGPLSPGRYQLHARAEGFRSELRTVVLPPAHAAVELGTLVLQPVASLAVVVDPTQAAMEPPFNLALDRQRENVVLMSEEWEAVRRVELDRELELTFGELSPGYYRLTLRKEGTDLGFVHDVELARGVHHQLILRPAPLYIRGTVRRKQRGVPAAQVWLRARDLDITCTSDRQGRYSARAWTPADYAVAVTLEGDPSPYPSGHLDLRAARPGDEVLYDIDLPAAGVQGTVVAAATGEPVEGARVKLVERRTDENLMSNMSVTTDAEGRFAFPYLTPGAQDHLEVTAEGYLPASASLDSTQKTDQTVVVTLERGTELKGRVHGPAGEPVAGATVACCAATVEGPFGNSTRTDAQGRFTLTVPHGTTVWAVAPGYALGWATAAADELAIRLPALASAPPMRLLNRSRDPVPRAKVTFSTETGLVMPWQALVIHATLNGLPGVSGSDGRLLPTGLAAGVYQAWLLAGNEMLPLGVVQVPSASEVVVEVPTRARR